MLSAFAALLILLGFLLLPIGIFSAIFPNLFKITSRWYALIIGSSFALTFGLALAISPDISQDERASVRSSGVILIILWLISAGFAHLLAKRARGQRDIPKPDRTAAEVDALRRAARKRRLEREQKEAEFDTVNVASSPSLSSWKRAAPIEHRTEKAAIDTLPLAAASSARERLEELYRQYKRGDLDLTDYRDEILAERATLSEDRAQLQSLRNAYSDEDYQEERELLDEDEHEIRWRLDWAEKRLRDATLLASHPDISGSGRWARFEYVDHYGEITQRDVVQWEVSGRYVRAYDRSRKAERNFRIDRINDWKSG